MPTEWPTFISKLKSEDGFWVLLPPWKVGMELNVDLDTRRVIKFKNHASGTLFRCEMINVLEPVPEGCPRDPDKVAWMAVELLEL